MDRISIKKWRVGKQPFQDRFRLFFFFFIHSFSHFRDSRSAGEQELRGKYCLVCDFEDFNFFDLQILRTCENDSPAKSSVVGVSGAKGSPTEGVCVAVTANKNVRKVWTASGITIDCPMLLFGLQCKSPGRDVVGILQREKKTLQTVIRCVFII
jgi:hypothetical protein